MIVHIVIYKIIKQKHQCIIDLIHDTILIPAATPHDKIKSADFWLHTCISILKDCNFQFILMALKV